MAFQTYRFLFLLQIQQTLLKRHLRALRCAVSIKRVRQFIFDTDVHSHIPITKIVITSTHTSKLAFTCDIHKPPIEVRFYSSIQFSTILRMIFSAIVVIYVIQLVLR